MDPEAHEYSHPDSLVSPEWLAARLDDPCIRVVDGRFDLVVGDDGSIQPHAMQGAYAEAHVPGAVFIDVMADLSDPDDPLVIPTVERFESLMGRLGIGNDTTVVIHDDAGGTWAARLWWALRYHGHDRVAMLDGGFRGWVAQGYPTESGIITAPPTTFTARLRPELRVTADEVAAAIDDPATCIVDALPEPVYSGAMSLYPGTRPGHIPGARNVPAPANVDPLTNTMLPADELARLWEPVGISADQRVITYCGGGVYASFALFALHLLGHDNVALYDASWSEWGADPSRPVEIST